MIATPTAAKMIRNELKENFSDTKFSVRSKSYSGGSSVTIYWTDGPKSAEADSIVSKYQYGHFNGMEDIYEYSNTDENLPQTKFVMTQRTMSDETRDDIINTIEKLYGVDLNDEQAVWKQFNGYSNEVIYREFNSNWFTKDISVEAEQEVIQVEDWMQKLVNCGCVAQ